MFSDTVAKRFWSRVDKHAECWIWGGSNNGEGGYGRFRTKKKSYGAHRVAWELTHGAIPVNMCVCHTCDVRLCVNPRHLFLGTYLINAADMVSKQRQARGERSGSAKLTREQILEARRLVGMKEVSGRQLARRYGVAHTTVNLAVKGRKWGWLNA